MALTSRSVARASAAAETGQAVPATTDDRAVQKLDSLKSKQPPRLSGRNPYSLFVGFLKVLLPALAVALVLLVVAWPQLVPDERQFRIGVAEISLEQAESLSMLNARFDGLDSNNQPFTVTADLATQDSGDSPVVDLELPKADITMHDGTWLAVTANSGRYQREDGVVDLNGDVVLFHDQGFEFRTDTATVDLNASEARGSDPVHGQGPLGILDAEGFRLVDKGQRIFFTGKSRLIIYQDGEGAK